jgi:hypothetical protein
MSLYIRTCEVEVFVIIEFLDFVNRLNIGKHRVSETGSISILGERRKIPILLDTLRRINLNHSF